MKMMMRMINDDDGNSPPVKVPLMLLRISDWWCVPGAVMSQIR